MARTYTYQGRDNDALWDIIDSVAHIPHAPGWPPINFERTFRAMTLGVPLAGNFRCSFTSVSTRNQYDNHATIKTPDVRQAVLKKFIKEEDLAYNVVLQRWLWRFIPGLFLNPLTFVMPKYLADMGRICVDATNIVGPLDDGAPNTRIPKPGTNDRVDENPPISYGTALVRCLTWIFNLRIDHPTTDLLMLPDDISSAFHQLFYHPRMMPVFASVFERYLCIPAGTIFGSASSPGYYMLSGELRAWLAGALSFGNAQARLLDSMVLPPAPSVQAVQAFASASPDAFNPGAIVMTSHGASALYPVFVDDTGNVNTRDDIIPAITASVLSAYLVFGFPGGDAWANRPPCINEHKWRTDLTHKSMFLGFEIDTRNMTLTWPLDKRMRLHHRITALLEAYSSHGFVKCREIAQALGLLRNGCAVLPLGSTMSLQLQHAFNTKVAIAMGGKPSPSRQRRFWDSAEIRLTPRLADDLKGIRTLLDINNITSTAWTRPIGLLIPRETQFTFFSDASYDGMGGWCPQLDIMWRITKEELCSLGFHMVTHSEPTPDDPPGAIHINVLEFVALTVNVWLALASCSSRDPTHKRHHTANFLADNTSAISWMIHAGRAKAPHARRLARFLQALLTLSPVPLQFQSNHISGTSNETADILSRPSRAESWVSVINMRPNDLLHCTPYLAPRKLLLALHGCITNGAIEATSAAKMTARSIPELRTSPPGWKLWDTTIGLYD